MPSGIKELFSLTESALLKKENDILVRRVGKNRSGSAEHEQHQGTVFSNSEKRGAGQVSADWQESGSEDSG